MSGNKPDATGDFFAALNDPTRWVVKFGVPIFKPHQRTDPATGQLIKVDLPKLYRIAANLQRLEKTGVPARITLGHTEPGKAETQQPPVGGYYRNARVQPFGPQGEPAIVVDEWLDPQYAPVRKNFPYRSSEYYDDTEQITGVALLTRDPYLDLGVVAYSRLDKGQVVTKSIRGPILYGAGGVRRPAYEVLMGDSRMYPPGTQPAPQQTPPQQQAPAGYAADGSPIPYGSWEDSGYNPSQTIPHQHASTGAVYAYPQQQRRPAGRMPTYNAGMPPRGASGGRSGGMSGGASGGMSGGASGTFPMNGMSGMPGASGGFPEEDDESGLHALHHHLGQAVEHLSRYLTGRRAQRYGGFPTPPEGPFPGEGGAGGVPGMGGGMDGMGMPPPGGPGEMSGAMPGMEQRPYSRPTQRQAVRRYSRQQTTGGGPVPTTISGLPVGYQMELDKRDMKIREMDQAMRVLFYERDQSDTQECAAEIRRLVQMGFDVGEFEFQELKKRPRDQREVYLNHIATKYARVPTEQLPPMLGDPTPGMESQGQNRPASEQEMNEALKLTAGDPSPVAYNRALAYIRGGGQAQNGPAFGPPAQNPMNQAAWPEGGQAPGGFTDPYEPSQNGHGGY